MVEQKRCMISITLDDYNYCKSHFIKISDLCQKAIKDYRTELTWALESLKIEIPPLVEKDDVYETPN